MPIDYNLYPDDWPEVRKAVLRRAGGNGTKPEIGCCCERCGERNYSVGYYNWNKVFTDIHYFDKPKDAFKKSRALRDKSGEKYVTIVIAVAHIKDPDPMNCEMDNLLALCQRCHHINDISLKQQHEQIRKRKKLITQGQMTIKF